MSRFLFTVWPYPGHVHPNVAVARALAARGHEPAFYTGASVAARLEREGIHVFPFEQLDEGRAESIVRRLDTLSLDWHRGLESKALLQEWLIGTVEAQLADLHGLVRSWRPDVIVCDPAMWGPLLVLHETAGVPLAIMSYVAACMLPGPEGPILGVPLGRPRGSMSRLVRRALRAVHGVVAAGTRREAEAIRARYGLEPMRTSVTAYAGQMPLYLVPTTRLYDRERSDLPSSVHYVGPCVWDGASAMSAPSWLSELPRDRPLVYVTEGTMHSKPAFLLTAALAGLARSPVRVVATTGAHRDPSGVALTDRSPDARIERFVPHSHLFPRTDVVVTTGGTGTVLAALAAGIPLVIVPMAWDQPENAWRVAEAGAGIRIPASQCSPQAIRAAVDRVLRDPSFRQNARRLGDDLARYGGAAEAATLLERLAAERRLVSSVTPTAAPSAAHAGAAS